MRLCALLIAAAAAGPVATVKAQVPAPSSESKACEPDGAVAFICGQRGAEDFVRVPGTDLILASWYGGGLVALDSKRRSTTLLYPSAEVRERFDKGRYGAACPGPPDQAQRGKFSVAGLALRPGANGRHLVYAVHFNWERAVDVFELDARGATPSFTWIGCVVAPKDVGVDGILPVEDDGFIITEWLQTGPQLRANLDRAKAGEITGRLWRWSPASGWKPIAGSEMSGPNGIESSGNGRWIYVAAWGSQELVRLPRRPGGGVPVRISLGFRPDNLRWARDGQLIVAGQTTAQDGTRVVKFDPATREVTPLVALKATAVFGWGTGAIDVGDTLWIGSAISDRIAIVPLARQRRP